jgi:hypothetical protein
MVEQQRGILLAVQDLHLLFLVLAFIMLAAAEVQAKAIQLHLTA